MDRPKSQPGFRGIPSTIPQPGAGRLGRPTPDGRACIQQLGNLRDRNDSVLRQLRKAPRVAKPPKDGSDEPGLPRLCPLDCRHPGPRKESPGGSFRKDDKIHRHQMDTTTGLQHQENRNCLRSMVLFRWESLAAPVVSYSAWSLRGHILVLCAPMSVSQCACKISYCSRITHKATLHPPVYASSWCFKALLYISSRSPKYSYNLRRNFCSHGDARQVYIGNTACYVHVR